MSIGAALAIFCCTVAGVALCSFGIACLVAWRRCAPDDEDREGFRLIGAGSAMVGLLCLTGALRTLADVWAGMSWLSFP